MENEKDPTDALSSSPEMGSKKADSSNVDVYSTVDMDSSSLPILHKDAEAFKERFEFIKCLGAGGFGSVHLVRDRRYDHEMVIKTIRKNSIGGEDHDAALFLEEASRLIKLKHPGIVRIYEANITLDGIAYILMEHLQGGSLKQFIERVGPIPMEQAATLVSEIARILAYVHAERIVHRDIKPANIMFDGEGKPYLVDFGLAFGDAEFEKGSSSCGTMMYCSPEQCQGMANLVDGRSDIYSLGIVLYELLSGQTPYRSKTGSGLQREISELPLRPIRQLMPEIPVELESILLTATQKDPTLRFRSATDFADALESFRKSLHPTQPSKVATVNEFSPSTTYWGPMLQGILVFLVVLGSGLGIAYSTGLFSETKNEQVEIDPFLPSLVLKVDSEVGGNPRRIKSTDLPFSARTHLAKFEAQSARPAHLYAYWVDSGENKDESNSIELAMEELQDGPKTKATYNLEEYYAPKGNALLIIVMAKKKRLGTQENRDFVEALRKLTDKWSFSVSAATPWIEFYSEIPSEASAKEAIVRGGIQDRPRSVKLNEVESLIGKYFDEFYGFVLLAEPNNASL